MAAAAPGWRGRPLATTALVIAAIIGGCRHAPPQALGTLEYDRVTLPSPVAEKIVEIDAREGERVEPGQVLLRLDTTRIAATAAAARAQAAQAGETLRELEVGPRREDIAQARAQLATAQAQAREARANYQRAVQLARRGVIAPAELDRARATLGTSEGQTQAAAARLQELVRGTRPEQIAQGQAAAAAAAEQAVAQEAILEKLIVTAPRAGVVDSLPYRLGDEAPVGAPLAVLLVGAAPYARVYVPEPIRARVHVGTKARVFVNGREQPIAGRVRMIRSEPSFTPYYALIGDDAARLSYLAEVQLTGRDARGLPAGLPARVEFPGAGEHG